MDAERAGLHAARDNANTNLRGTDLMPDTDVHTFEFSPEHDGSLPLESAVFQALGAASVCWEPMHDGVFESERAKAIGDALIAYIKETVGLDAERHRRQIEFLEILADGGALQVNGVPWREMFDRINAIVSDPV